MGKWLELPLSPAKVYSNALLAIYSLGSEKTLYLVKRRDWKRNKTWVELYRGV